MEKEIREEIESLFGRKGVTITDIKKRLMNIAPPDETKVSRQGSKYIFDVKLRIPGNKEIFNISGTKVAEILKKLELKFTELDRVSI